MRARSTGGRGPSRLLSGLVTGLALGAAWGVLARVFMRLLSTTPGFSWAGTLFILGLSALLGGGLGLVAGARASNRTRWWRLAPLPGLLLFAGPGLVLLPGAVGVALAASARRVWLRALLCVAGLAGMLALLLGSDEDPGARTGGTWLGLGLLVVADVLLGLGLHEWWRRWAPAAGGGGSPAAGHEAPVAQQASA
ncbi:hypothetical protein [Intrasporangium sp. YIM S08009]|uniref:hypothetical protein n=1 Tax=Intrasporangium zincisolvens TaxID=3080018 RepID=UPI002B06199B|nr:hypothetical protein [Intrasporangium sp. YIM S08009]